MPLRVEASAEEWQALLDGVGDTPAPPPDLDELLAPSDEVARVSRRIAGQYVEVLAHFASRAFSGRSAESTTAQAAMAVDALLRLADATGNREQAGLLKELLHLIEPVARGASRSRARENALRRLRDWLPAFAGTLDADDAARLRDLVRWDATATPLLEELHKVHGIGPKRLQRLYAAGLFTVDALASADPDDVAAVTGIPRRLANEVARATRAYAADEPQRCVAQLVRTAGRLRKLMGTRVGDQELDAAARDALAQVEVALQALAHPIPRSPS